MNLDRLIVEFNTVDNVESELVRIEYMVSWVSGKCKARKRVRTRNDFAMLDKNLDREQMRVALKDIIKRRHPNTALAGFTVP